MDCSLKPCLLTRLGPVLRASGLVLLVACGSAKANLVGDTVNVTHDYPNTSTVESDLGNQVVGSGVEYPSWQGHMSVDVSDDNILFTVLDQFGFVNGPFNGFVLTDLSDADITGASINSATNVSGLLPSYITYDATHVWVDMELMGFMPGQVVSIDVQTRDVHSVPEPASFALVLAGLSASWFGARRRWSASA